MFSSLTKWFRRHPVVAQVLLWCIPAFLVGMALRAILLSYSPYAYWGSDSESYMGFSYNLLDRGKISLHEKRRYIYPLFALIPSISPWGTLKTLAWLQHALGLVTVFAIGYSVKKLFTQWRLWIVPVTVLYAVFPIFLWYEHEFLGETPFFISMIWMLAGWLAWTGESNRARKLQLWWYFFIPFACLALCKPSGRFLLPGIVLALLFVKAWRVLRWYHWGAVASVIGLTFTMGQSGQGAWLLYTSAFPMTRLDTPLHAEYKAEIADKVRYARERIDRYASEDSDSGIKKFLKFPDRHDDFPLWAELGREGGEKQTRIYRDLAKEAIYSRPDLFLYIAVQRVFDSANPDTFKERRFKADYFSDRMEHSYQKIRRSPRLAQRLFGLSAKAPDPDFETIKRWITPKPDSRWAIFMQQYASFVNRTLALVTRPPVETKGGSVAWRPTFLGWLALAGGVLSVAIPRYRVGIGVWTVAMGGYLVGVFLIGSANPRFFALAWPVIFLLFPLPFDWVISLLRKSRRVETREEVTPRALSEAPLSY